MRRSVSVHHNFAERTRVIEKGTPDPDQILFVLRSQGHARPHPGMDEEIIAEADA